MKKQIGTDEKIRKVLNKISALIIIRSSERPQLKAHTYIIGIT